MSVRVPSPLETMAQRWALELLEAYCCTLVPAAVPAA